VGLAGGPEPTSAELLLDPTGAQVLAAAAQTVAEVGDGLRAAELLRRRFPADVVAAALTQVDLRSRATEKFADPSVMLFTRAGLEQASTARVAAHRAGRFGAYEAVADLCCGIGADLLALAGVVPQVLAVDRDPLHLRLARHNVSALGLGERVTTWLGDVEAADLTGVEAAFVDPARRSGTRRLGPGDSSPALPWCFALGERLPTAVKAAPGIDHALVPPGWELEFVAEDGALKESVLWSPQLASETRRATVLQRGAVHSLIPTGASAAQVRPPGRFVLDPSPAVTRAGLVADLADALGAWQTDPLIAFLSADTPAPTPYGRWIVVEASLPWDVKTLAAELRRLDVGAVDLRRRGLAGDVEDVRKRLRLKGSRRVTVLMTRVLDRPWAFVGTPLEPGR
jgi:SAM-dependent methyltransferase